MSPVGERRRLLVPETIQTSAMDCGPAALQSLLGGFGIAVSYGRLREVCHTDVDGTSIDALVELASGLGLAAEELLVPPDHLVAGAGLLPALAVVDTPLGRHFLVLWRRHGGRIQIMDPARGRRWLRPADLLGELYLHRAVVPAAGWRSHGVTPAFLRGVEDALGRVGAGPALAAGMIRSALEDPSWRSLAALDAASRLGRELVAVGAARRGRPALGATIERFERARRGELAAIPAAFWSAHPTGGPAVELEMRGAVIMAVKGRRPAGAPAAAIGPRSERGFARLKAAAPRPPALREALALLFRGEGRLGPGLVAGGLVLAAAATTLEIILLRRLYDVAIYLGLERQRIGLLAVFLLFGLGLLLLELQVTAAVVRLGRRVEGRIRIALLERLPRLPDGYFRTRLASDLAMRVHHAHLVRRVPQVGMEVARRSFQILFAVVGLVWLAPESAPLAILAAVAAVGLPLAGQRVLAERGLRQQTVGGALGRHYLDVLLGLVAVRAHGGQRAMRREHGKSMLAWLRAGRSVARAAALFEAAQSLLGVAIAAALVASHVGAEGQVRAGGFLIVVYWALQLPALGSELALAIRSAVPLRAATLRLLDPLRAAAGSEIAADPAPPVAARGVDLRLEGVAVSAGGREILGGIDVAIERGAEVAIVGASGAGKSTLLGLLLGWHEPAAGRIWVDGRKLDGEILAALRRRTTWVDPAVQLWNRSLLDNLAYGGPPAPPVPIGRVVDEAGMLTVLERLPGGLQTPLGDGGGLLSGGDGQRVRFGRGLLRGPSDLVLLDEPFRGLDRAERAALLDRARRWWRGATLLCVTHDVGETIDFPRVLVVDAGAIVEDGHPRELAARPRSRYRALLDAERAVHAGIWRDPTWRRLRVEDGRVHEELDEPWRETA